MRRRGRLRRLAAGGALAAVLAGLVACAPRTKPPEPIVFWQYWPDEVIGPLLRRFESEHPGLQVREERLHREGAGDSIAAAIDAGRVPDLCAVPSRDMPRLLATGALADWSAGVADLRGAVRGWPLSTVGDAVYGLPWMLDVRALFWNKALFARARLDTARAPETWTDVRRAAAAIQRLGRGVHGYGVSANDRGRLLESFMPYAWGAGGDILTAGLDSACFDSPANREALEFYLSLRDVGTIGMQDTLDREFVHGRLGLEVSGGWLLDRIPRESPGLRFGVAPVPRPARDRGSHASFAGGEVLVSFVASKRKPDALRLARFLARPDVALELARQARSVQPAAKGVDTLPFYREHPEQQAMARQLETARFAPRHPEWEAMSAGIEDAIEQALFDRVDAAQAVANANARIAELAGRR